MKIDVDHIPVLIWASGPENDGIYFNQAWLEFTGRTLEQELGGGWIDDVHPDDRPRLLECQRQHEADEQARPFHLEFRLRRHDGTYRWMLDSGFPRPSDDGRFEGFVGWCQDIHERREAQNRLSQQTGLEKQQLQAVLDVLPVAVFLSDRDGRILHANHAAQTLWGQAPLSAGVHEYAQHYQGYWPATMSLVKSEEWALARAVQHGHTIAAEELYILNHRGECKTILNYALPILDDQEQTVGGVAVNVDITTRKAAITQLALLNQHLEQRVAERTASLQRHQRRLRALAAELVLAEQRQRRKLAVELHDFLAQLLVVSKMKTSRLLSTARSTTMLKLLVELDKLLDDSLRYTRTLVAELSPTVLYDAGLVPALHWLAAHMKQHGLDVRVLASGPDIQPHLDQSVLLFAAVRELLFNVVKHAGVNEAEVAISDGPEQLQIRVSDRGRGFQPAQRPVEDDGHFGLFSVKERLDALGGTFRVDSAPGQGTCVTLSVPRHDQAPLERRTDAVAGRAAPVEAAGSSDGAKGIRILLADDHAMVREGLRSVLESHDDLTIVGEAANGEQAVNMARTLCPDVIVMDVNMPVMNGIEATRRVVAERSGVRVVGLSVHDDRELGQTMLDAGASMFLTKGGPSDALCQAIRQVHHQQQQNRS